VSARNPLSVLLVPIDAQTPSNAAISTALELASAYGSRTIFCNSVDLTSAIARAGTPFGADVTDLFVTLADTATSVLHDAGQLAADRHVPAETLELSGPPAEAILEAARTTHADAIVMGTHGRSGAGRFFLGSVAEGVLRRADLPVFVAAAACDHGFGRIAVALDAAPAAQAALDYALDLARPHAGTVLLVHAIDESTPEKFAEASAILDAAEAKARARGIRTETYVCNAKPAESVLRTAREEQADLIAIGTHGRTGLSRMFLGSVAEEVIRHSPVPVVALRTRVKRPQPVRAARTVSLARPALRRAPA
jgi:nucleotide-binding universal stress UspA family protein